MSKKKRTPAVTEATARIKLAEGQRRPPDGYCLRCWRQRLITRSTFGKNRCDEHHEQISREAAEVREKGERRHHEEAESAGRLFTAMKWTARETGAGYTDSPEELDEIVFGAFWNAVPDKRILSQGEIDLAHRAAIAALEAHTGQEAEAVPCPDCGDRSRRSRAGNNFNCVNCGWEAPEGAFGAIYVNNAAHRRRQRTPRWTSPVWTRSPSVPGRRRGGRHPEPNSDPAVRPPGGTVGLSGTVMIMARAEPSPEPTEEAHRLTVDDAGQVLGPVGNGGVETNPTTSPPPRHRRIIPHLPCS